MSEVERDIVFCEDDFGLCLFDVFQGSEPEVGIQIFSILQKEFNGRN
jgi:hypothetical protein